MWKSRRVLLVPLALIIAVTLAACLPQLEIYPTLFGTGSYVPSTSQGGPSTAVTLGGEIRCNRSTTEPLDMWITIAGTDVTEEGSGKDPVLGDCFDTWRTWRVTVNATQPPPSEASVKVTFCTNPAEYVDEDCQSVSRYVRFRQG